MRDGRAPAIQSTGPPPERHAARVVAEMCRWLAVEQFRMRARLQEHLKGAAPKLGNPKAQRRWLARLRRDPALHRLLLGAQCEYGTRGRATFNLLTWRLVRPNGDYLVEGEPLPEKPYLTCMLEVLSVRSRDDCGKLQLITFSHHAMQRLAERCEARTVDDLLDALRELAIWMLEHGDTEATPTLRVPVAGGVAIIQPTEAHGLLVKTVLPKGETDA